MYLAVLFSRSSPQDVKMAGVLVRNVWHQSKGGLVFLRQETCLEDVWVRFLSSDNLDNAQMHPCVSNFVNPLLPKSYLQILLCLMPDDFTRQMKTP